MAAWKVLLVAMKAHQGWRRIPPAQRRAIIAHAQKTARARGPAVARAVREQGPDVARRVSHAVRESRKGR